MINEYETVIILSPTAGADRQTKIKEKLSKIFDSFKAEIKNEQDWGNRKLAYPIQKFEYGHYFFYNFNADGKIVDQIESTLKLDESVVRFLTVKIDPIKDSKLKVNRPDKPEEVSFGINSSSFSNSSRYDN